MCGVQFWTLEVAPKISDAGLHALATLSRHAAAQKRESVADYEERDPARRLRCTCSGCAPRGSTYTLRATRLLPDAARRSPPLERHIPEGCA
jgi:hypothetical protein